MIRISQLYHERVILWETHGIFVFLMPIYKTEGRELSQMEIGVLHLSVMLI